MKIKLLFLAALFLSVLSYQADAQPPRVPDSINFADEVIRFDRHDLYERMDRELITFSYMHTTSILMLKRANRIFRTVVPVLLRNGVPEDLKYLMVIESNLDPLAVSSAGAVGLWQFMPATGKQYGLEVNSNVDERYNIEKATEAACKYLKAAYEKYGNWMTVAAAYNAGTAGISSRLSTQHQTSSMDILLNSETARYMFRILAAKMLFDDPESFGFKVEAKDKYQYIRIRKTIEVNDPIEDLVAFAEKNGITYLQLKEANPWLREYKLNNASHKKYYIDIPENQ